MGSEPARLRRMGGGPSKSRTPSPPHPKARPKTLVSKLDGATRAFDLIQLTDQDTVRLAKEARVQAVVSELERGHDAVLVEVTTRHVAEVEELVEAHQRRVEVRIAQHDHAALIARSCMYCGTRPSTSRRIGVESAACARTSWTIARLRAPCATT